MNIQDATEESWKNGYLTALSDIEQRLTGDKEAFKQLANKLIECRCLRGYRKNIETEM